jgi:hypothetical protein
MNGVDPVIASAVSYCLSGDYQYYEEAFQQVNQARLLANRFPCGLPLRDPIVARIGTEEQEALNRLAKIDPAKEAVAQTAWNNTLNADRCAKLETPTPEPAASAVTSGGLTTLCSFNNGPRVGTILDLRKFGFGAVPVGGPCNDGSASTGITIQQP